MLLDSVQCIGNGWCIGSPEVPSLASRCRLVKSSLASSAVIFSCLHLTSAGSTFPRAPFSSTYSINDSSSTKFLAFSSNHSWPDI